ncbi:uncharacterized protein LOC133336982 [Musca vetustissima]|uniref:uncharacterized protein LOC133336982 n=1 Tax=Musca vetustissima TaxID=27455 RepID=UPI002AB63657|nr:uncharacterized protein LOC133336982 [Musca vetustissima]
MDDNDYKMCDISATACSKNDNNDQIEAEEENDTSLWSIDDDTMFYAKGLKNHSAGKGKSVFVTWNENYLMNFVFKTSTKTKKTTLTKVRLTMPMCPASDEREEILDMLILEMNTLLLMQSGRVYYFSSVKSIHCVPWLTNVRCISSCPYTQFSVIRLNGEDGSKKQLLLEVYQDIPQLGKCPSIKDALCHRYDITFDMENIFNCDWICDRYILLSLITDEDNIEFLRKIISIGNVIRRADEKLTVELNQEVHIFTVSGNLFVLMGGNEEPKNVEDQEYTIQLLNTYATTIEYIQIDCKKNLLIVLLESGHMDIWYKSTTAFGSVYHLKHEIAHFTHYDYNALDNTFYITKPDEVTQLRMDKSDKNNEYTIKEVHKSVSGMIACTWVESLQQLICLSINNIFYRLCFDISSKEAGGSNIKDLAEGYEHFSSLYALTNKKMKLLLSRSQVVTNLIELPKQLHEAVELEWQKQQLLSLGYKNLWQHIFKCSIEYHNMESTIEYQHQEDNIFIRTTFDRDVAEEIYIYTLLRLTTTTTSKRDKLFLTIMQCTTWLLQLSFEGKTLSIQIPPELLNKKLHLLVKCSTKSRQIVPEFSLHFLAFVEHNSTYICIRNEVPCCKIVNTYRDLFSLTRQINIYRNAKLNIDYQLERFHKATSATQNQTLLKHTFANINKQELLSCLDLNSEGYQNADCLKLYYLQEHAIDIRCDTNRQLEITTENPEAMFYFKIMLMWKLKSIESIDLTNANGTSLQKIMHCQSEIETLYGSLTSMMENDAADHCLPAVSLHLENLTKMYIKLRSEFDNIFR